MTDALGLGRGWHVTRIDRIATVEARIGWKALTADEYVDEGYAFLATPNIKATEIDFDNINRITRFRYEESPGLRLRLGDVLLAKDGNTLGITNVVTHLPEPATVNGSIAVLRPLSIEPRFLRYWLASSYIQGKIGSLKDGMGVPHLFQRDINRLPVLLPPLDEQRGIADFLDTETTRLDAMTSALARRSALASARIQALRDSLLIPRVISPRGPDWPMVPIKHVASFFTDGDWIESPFIVDAGIRLIQTGNVGVGAYREQGFRYVSEDTFRKLRCTEVAPGDVLISRLASPAGRACLAPHLPDRMIASVDVAILRPTDDLDPAFAVHYMSTSAHLQLADLEARGTTMQRLSRRQLGDLLLPVPPLPEQRRLREGLDDAVVMAGRLNTANDAQLRVLAERRQALITAAVTGQLDVTTARGGRS